MKVIKAQVQLNEGADVVVLWVDLPSPILGALDYSKLTVTFSTTYDYGAKYVEKHFGIKPEIINRRWDKK